MKSAEVKETVELIKTLHKIETGFWFDQSARVQVGLGMVPYAYGDTYDLVNDIRNRMVITARDSHGSTEIISGFIPTDDAGNLTFSYEVDSSG